MQRVLKAKAERRKQKTKIETKSNWRMNSGTSAMNESSLTALINNIDDNVDGHHHRHNICETILIFSP
jgi:hypothetical protein